MSHMKPLHKGNVEFHPSSVTDCVSPPEHDLVLVTFMLFGRGTQVSNVE